MTGRGGLAAVPHPSQGRAEQDYSGGPSPGQLYSLGPAWGSPPQPLRFHFCQTPIQHLTSTFIKFVIFLRKPNKKKHLRTR